MGIDKVTKPSSMNITIDDSELLFKILREKAIEYYKDEKVLAICDEDFLYLEPSEFYYDDNENEIVMSFSAHNKGGDISIFLRYKLSDIIMIDLMQAMIRRLNKLKVAMEALK